MARQRSALSAVRRGLLKTGVAGAALFAPGPWARVWAQTPQGVQLLRLPKVALIIGNGKYKDTPLKNPVNDARAIGETLTGLGFEVTLRVDAARAAMDSAITAYVNTLAARKCVGLFYYAGHGIQLAWKNYLLPVDANIDVIGDVAKQSFELNSLIAGLTRASNPMNVIMLDACRDNPFGEAKQPEQKGLSQMDAPTNTILAYATAPGNTASDGAGANGLYTENLLREIRVKEAKVEDIFKRIRLNVRRSSKGAQIPWESTSLEDDFYFLPPAHLQVAADEAQARALEEARARALAEERALWESIQTATETAPFENYLRTYPSGQFADLAQLQLDRLLAKQGEKAVRVVSAKGNPYSKGSARADTAYRVGDSYSYRVTDIDSGQVKSQPVLTVTRITDHEVVYNRDGLHTDLLGNTLRTAGGRRTPGQQNMPLVYELGRRWVTRFALEMPDGRVFDSEVKYQILRREAITVPAGSFDCFYFEGAGKSRGPAIRIGRSIEYEAVFRFWMAPEQCRRPVRTETTRVAWSRGNRTPLENERRELMTFRQG